MPPGSWNPTTLVQGILWILLGLLLCPEPGTGRSEGRGLRQGQSILKKCTAIPSVSSPVQGKTGILRRPQSRGTSSLGTQILPALQGQGRGWGKDWDQKKKNQEGFPEEETQI